MYDIITFGSAGQDIFVKSKKFLPVAGKAFTTGEGICLTLGSKIEVDDIFLASGGGGTNTAATFVKQGFRVAYCGMVGDDVLGGLIIEELKKLKIDTTFIKKTRKKSTNLSVILSYPGQDRTILGYRGASDLLQKKDIPWAKIKKARWFYLASFSGKLADLTEYLISFAKKNQIKVAFNPGFNQLNLPRPTLERILRKIDVLILNREEASLLTKVPYQKEKEIFKKIDEITKGIAIMTKGSEGVVVSDGKYLFRAGSLGLKFVDATGAGDAFGAGFVSGLIQKNDPDRCRVPTLSRPCRGLSIKSESRIPDSIGRSSIFDQDIIYAIQLAMANSGLAIGRWGAKEGLLKKGQKFKKVKVIQEKCSENNLCQVKL